MGLSDEHTSVFNDQGSGIFRLVLGVLLQEIFINPAKSFFWTDLVISDPSRAVSGVGKVLPEDFNHPKSTLQGFWVTLHWSKSMEGVSRLPDLSYVISGAKIFVRQPCLALENLMSKLAVGLFSVNQSAQYEISQEVYKQQKSDKLQRFRGCSDESGHSYTYIYDRRSEPRVQEND